MTIAPFEEHLPNLAADVFVAPGAVVIGDVVAGSGSSVWYNVVIRGDVQPIRIGARTNIQDLSMVHVTSGRFSTTIGDDVTVGHRAILHGCIVENGALIGMGAIVLDGAVIGAESIIGAGAVVTQGTRIPPRSLALGSPARVIRELRDDEVAGLYRSAAGYVDLSRRHGASLRDGAK
jgi:carbonic anhydrase/acetyltransferase-like protein (isoleucine patch superfamily)